MNRRDFLRRSSVLLVAILAIGSALSAADAPKTETVVRIRTTAVPEAAALTVNPLG